MTHLKKYSKTALTLLTAISVSSCFATAKHERHTSEKATAHTAHQGVQHNNHDAHGHHHDGKHHDHHGAHGHDMHHADREVDPNNPPKISLHASKDSNKGWNLHLPVKNFTFTPAQVGESNEQTNQGHVHLYVDGKKHARLYGEWYHLVGLSEGEHTVKVTLNADNHSTLVLNGEEIAATVTINK